MFARRINRGVAALDAALSPGWVNAINLKQLALWHGHRCVLGQLPGGFQVNALRVCTAPTGMYLSKIAHYGFDIFDLPRLRGSNTLTMVLWAMWTRFELMSKTIVSPVLYWLLKVEWRRTIRRLRAERQPVVVSQTDYGLAR